MARKHTQRRQSHKSSSRNRQKGNNNSLMYIIGGVAALAIIGLIIWFVTRSPKGYQFQRADLDQYVELQSAQPLLDDGAAAYFDMSDDMNDAYIAPSAKAVLSSVINKIAGNNAIGYFGLGSSKIYPLAESHTALYNFLLDPKNYQQQMAPIQATLDQIVEKNQPALLLSDFEEYHSGNIHKAAYAKEAFIQWLSRGNNITFYAWDYLQGKNAVPKKMFLAVFDDNANRLLSMIETAIENSGVDDSFIHKYVLGGPAFAYPTRSNYPSMTVGGNYRNSKNVDAATAVLDGNNSEGYKNYSHPIADVNGNVSNYAPLDWLSGRFAEYYPLGVSYADALVNIKALSETGVPVKDQYEHLLANLYIDFSAQNGFIIEGIEARTFDITQSLSNIRENKSTDDVQSPEVYEFITANLVTNDVASKLLGKEWQEIVVDFDTRFNGTLNDNIKDNTPLKANIVISKAEANITEARSFFEWPGNPSLANSVVETLTSPQCSPVGRVIYTYYIRTIK